MNVGRLAIAGLGLLATPLFTRVLSPKEYGTLALIIVIASASATVPTQWLTGALLRYGPSTPQRQLHATLWHGLAISLFGVIGFALSGAVATLHRVDSLVLLTTAYAASEAAYYTFWILSRAKLRAWSFVMGGVLRNSISVLLVAVRVLVHGEVSLVWLLASLVAADLVAIIVMVAQGRTGGGTADRASLKQWWVYGWPLIPHYAFGVSFSYADRFMLLALSGPEAVGRFAATYDLMFSITSLTVGLIGLTTVPMIFAARDSVRRSFLLRQLRRRVMVASLVVPSIIVVAWPILSGVLIGEALRVSDWWFTITLGASFGLLSYRSQYMTIAVQLMEKTKVQTISTGLGLLTNIAMNLVMIPAFGITGAAVSTLIGAVVALMAMATLSRWAASRSGSRDEHASTIHDNTA